MTRPSRPGLLEAILAVCGGCDQLHPRVSSTGLGSPTSQTLKRRTWFLQLASDGGGTVCQA
jgi:hypothetical protein